MNSAYCEEVGSPKMYSCSEKVPDLHLGLSYAVELITFSSIP